MKQVMFALAPLVALLVAGCQDSSVTEPTTHAPSHASTFQKPDPTSNVIVFKGIVADPDKADGFGVEIRGQAWFVRIPVFSDKDEQFPNEQIDLTLRVEAEIRSLEEDGFSYKVEGTSTDRIVMSNQTDSAPATLTKTYSSVDGDAQISLHLLFEVSSTGVAVRNMWLTRTPSFTNDSRQATDGGKQ
jgi:hypothetical protein